MLLAIAKQRHQRLDIITVDFDEFLQISIQPLVELGKGVARRR